MKNCYCKVTIKSKSKEELKSFYNDFLSDDKTSLLMDNIIPLKTNESLSVLLLWGNYNDIENAKLIIDGKYINISDDFDSDIITLEYSIQDAPNEVFWHNCCQGYSIDVEMFYYDGDLEYAGHSFFSKDTEEINYYESDEVNVFKSLELYEFLLKNNIITYEYMYNVFREKQRNNELSLCDIQAIKQMNKLHKDFNFEITNQVIYNFFDEEEIPEIKGGE